MKNYNDLKRKVWDEKLPCSRCDRPYYENSKGHRQIHVHHRDFVHVNDDADNLEVLCKPCHTDKHITDNPNYFVSEETRAKLSKAHTGYKHTDEARANMSKAQRGKNRGVKLPVSICPHCSKQGGGNAMKQWHFDNCKQKPEEVA